MKSTDLWIITTSHTLSIIKPCSYMQCQSVSIYFFTSNNNCVVFTIHMENWEMSFLFFSICKISLRHIGSHFLFREFCFVAHHFLMKFTIESNQWLLWLKCKIYYKQAKKKIISSLICSMLFYSLWFCQKEIKCLMRQ